MNRREFLGAAATAVGGHNKKSGAESRSGLSLALKGRKNSGIKRWDVITIGNLSRNRYWGESEDRGVRSAICSCTVISGDGFHIMVDPSLKDEKAMATELDRRTGLNLDEIDVVFITHQHGDHHFGLKHFPKAKWLAGAEVAAGLNKSERYGKPIVPADDSLFEAVEILSTPGHTMDHRSLRFDCKGLSVIIAGDAVATQDFWVERMGYFNAVDFDLSARTMNKIASIADIVVPGHDNHFLCL
ncbi:MAG: MBL fold metallo-hydrolase [Phycisphaerae bacterium]|nr:MBL fold metallo-hydrolase [Phycisphaerae bacterium]